MMYMGARGSSLFKIGLISFCFMCLFFATFMASKYEHQKTQTEIQTNKVKELEEKIHEISFANKELCQIRSVLVREKEQMAKEINALREKSLELEDWKLTIEQGTSKGNLAADLQSTDDAKKKLPGGNEPDTSINQP
ncbi:MAG: hypothetical protein NG747_10000 [Candidatus Brocadia sp.]|nr:hypothetical protein [Candidatus Brocadia sp.]